MCVGWFPIGKTVVTIWVVVVCCWTNGLDGGTPPTANQRNTFQFSLISHSGNSNFDYVWIFYEFTLSIARWSWRWCDKAICGWWCPVFAHLIQRNIDVFYHISHFIISIKRQPFTLKRLTFNWIIYNNTMIAIVYSFFYPFTVQFPTNWTVCVCVCVWACVWMKFSKYESSA